MSWLSIRKYFGKKVLKFGKKKKTTKHVRKLTVVLKLLVMLFMNLMIFLITKSFLMFDE
jgi:hypothetical protein